MCNNNGAKTILPFLCQNNMWLKWNKLSTHREASIEFIKYVNTSITFQVSIRHRIELPLYIMHLTEEDTTLFLPSTDRKMRKGSNESNIDEFEPIQLPVFDLFTKKIGYGNGKRKVTITAFEVKYYPNDVLILQHIFFRLPASDDKVPSNNHIHFAAYSLP